jgi:hypothetical protein
MPWPIITATEEETRVLLAKVEQTLIGGQGCPRRIQCLTGVSVEGLAADRRHQESELSGVVWTLP